jgi:putative component of membrane protein insertase Oxa1/YidC/SpoIIIJ protein YidD
LKKSCGLRKNNILFQKMDGTMKPIIKQMRLPSMLIIWTVLVLAWCPVNAENEYDGAKPTGLFTYPVFFFQKFISGADGDRCLMYPSCSHYAINAFKKHGNITGWIMTCDRLLRCGRDEIRYSEPIWINREKHFQDQVEDNDFWWQNPSEGYSSP